MPYIDDKRRHQVILNGDILTAGELNFYITSVILDYLTAHGESYQTYNDILGVLSAIPQELYRRKIAPYEDKKIEENGDVY